MTNPVSGDALTALVAKVLQLPRRTERLGGQQFSYVKLDDVLAILGDTTETHLHPEDYAVIADAIEEFLGFDITTREQQDRITRWGRP